jgi:hypothetical protein
LKLPGANCAAPVPVPQIAMTLIRHTKKRVIVNSSIRLSIEAS